jgi:hypothetical protein
VDFCPAVLRELGPSSLDLQGSPPLDLRSPHGETLGFYYLIMEIVAARTYLHSSVPVCVSLSAYLGAHVKSPHIFRVNEFLTLSGQIQFLLPLALPC